MKAEKLSLKSELAATRLENYTLTQQIAEMKRKLAELETWVPRSVVQPNPGWGSLCESCKHRDRSNIEHDDNPCALFKKEFRPPFKATLARYSINAADVSMHAVLNRDFVELCKGYEEELNVPSR